MNITNNCNFCHKALELQGALDLGLISERNRCSEKIAQIEYEKQVLSDRYSTQNWVMTTSLTSYWRITKQPKSKRISSAKS